MPLQPRSYPAFRCIGADCEDTCCIGWAVNVDRATYEAYQRSDDAELSGPLHELVTINAASGSDDNYARIALTGAGCPFLSENLCSIQKRLGEAYLSKMCATYPRVMSVVDGVLYRSLHLSCPEAARVMLLDPDPLEFDESVFEPDGSRLGNLSVLTSVDTRQYFREVRGLVIWILQYRKNPLWQRLVIVGSLCDQLELEQSPEVFAGYRDAVERGLFDEGMRGMEAHPAQQLEVAVELIISRIGSDHTSPRFLECYSEFLRGLEWNENSSLDDIGSRYATARAEFYEPFLSGHGYMLEHYFVNYVHGSLFPFGAQESSQNLGMLKSITNRYLLMAAYYAVMKTVLIGMAGFHKGAFGTAQVLKLVQTFAKTFEHSTAFPEKALEILAQHGVKNCVGMAGLLRD